MSRESEVWSWKMIVALFVCRLSTIDKDYFSADLTFIGCAFQ